MPRDLNVPNQKNSIPAPLSYGISASIAATNMTMQYEFLKNVVETLNIGIVVIDNSDIIIVFNKLAGEMLHQEPIERIGSSILRCHGKVSEEPVVKMIADLKNREMDHYEGWVNFRERMLYEYIYPLWSAKGECLGIVEELHDAAERAGYFKMKGEWKEVHVSGLGEKSPRSPHERVQ